ncbi:lactonase family protein [Streptomyces sp. PTM05]|uniref:Lactonase family protein n=1 Tax=Streptantibioticus parmotrematis TaxID=2873249 RepID=A0ABS7QQZ9_9ACTN|nr:lactonase family protein [Streptantibioticus parmotrematis]MBY8885595.1 lactonase family protein [Streptantibioticus parmotrematis]
MSESATGTLRAYIGSFTSAGGRGVVAARVDPVTGALTATHATDAVPDPSYLTLSPDRATLYAVSEREPDGAAAAFTLRDPDAPEPVGTPVPVGGASPTHLCVADGHLLTANYGSGSVSVLPLPQAAPGAPRHVLRHEGAGPDPDRQEGPHAHAVLPDPGGRWVLTVDLGTDAVHVYALDPATGRLTVHRTLDLPPGTGPRHLTFHPRGHRAYLVGELASTVTALAWDADTGTLTISGAAATVPGNAGGEANYPSEAVVSPDGRFLWIANRGHDSIAVFTLDGDGDQLELTDTVSCGGRWPRDLALGPTGRHLYAANERSGDVTWFAIDAATGIPRRAGSLPAPAASCVTFA